LVNRFLRLLLDKPYLGQREGMRPGHARWGFSHR
jgi:hypothetical protein